MPAVTAAQLQEGISRMQGRTTRQTRTQEQEQEQEPEQSVFVTFIDGSEFEAKVRPSDFVRVLRSQVSERRGITDARVRLVFDNQVLDSHTTVQECGITDGASVNAMIMQPLFQGSQVYDKIAKGMSTSGLFDTESAVHDALEDSMHKKAQLNDAFAAAMRLRKRRDE
eukprot:gb/GFBE01043234.1/.p1 GENE.gb/GFBE01043234.1/~~gb/GFBE01043234.1/.p1  ORF type:complete len:168 (+),score=29.47 gb/GFBE01043234.1/:1-504(+)